MSRVGAECIAGAVSAIDKAETDDKIIGHLVAFVEPFGLSHAAMAQIVNPVSMTSVKAEWRRAHNLPADWFDAWLDRNALIHDPIISCALRSTRPFFWSQAYKIATATGMAVLEAGRDIGLNDGLAIPMRSLDGPPGIVTLGGAFPQLTDERIRAIHLVATHAFGRMGKRWPNPDAFETKELSSRETEVLHWVAAGKTNWEISNILTISMSTVEKHVAAAKEKLGATNKSMAVVRAISRGLILPC